MTPLLRRIRLALGLAIILASVLRPADARAFYQAAPDTTRPKQALVSADTLIGAAEDYYRLVGNVFVQQDSTVLRSKNAIQYVVSETFIFTGNVVIVERGDTLRADSVYYDRRTKIGRAHGRVFLTDGEVRVRAPSGIYFTGEKRARFEEGVTLVDSTAEITSRFGTYWSDEKRADLAGAVQLHAERTYLEADSLTYFRDTEIAIALHNVFIERIGGEEESEADSTVRTLLFSQWAYNDQRAGLSRVRGRPLLVQLRQDSTGAEVDTLVVQALHLEAVEQDSVRRLIAVDSVRIWQADLAAVADSVVYERLAPPADTTRSDTTATALARADSVQAGAARSAGAPGDSAAVRPAEETRLYREPILWLRESQISGDTVRVKGRGSDVDSLFVRQNAFVAQRDTLIERINQVRGQYLVGFFENDSTRVFTVGPNAETIYFQRDEEDRPDGGLQVSGDRAVFHFVRDEPREIRFPGSPQGTYYSESVLPDPFQLDGFRWIPERRPTRAGLLRDERVVERLSRYVFEGATPADSTSTPPGAAPEAGAAKDAPTFENQ